MHLETLNNRCERQWLNNMRAYRLPLVQQAVGDDTVDLFCTSQGVVLLNDLNYLPRPIFQSYSAYTEYLLRKNEEFYADPGAPEYVIFRPETINHRLPALDDGPALKQLLFHYRPVLVDRDYLLLKKDMDSYARPVPSEIQLVQRSVVWGEWVDLEAYANKYLCFSLEIRYSLAGKLVKFLLRPPGVQMELRCAAHPKKFNIVPAMARQGVLLQPLIRSMRDFGLCYLLAPGISGREIPKDQRVQAFRFVEQEGWLRYLFRPRIVVRLFEYPREAVVPLKAR
jgi:hypothetical protein